MARLRIAAAAARDLESIQRDSLADYGVHAAQVYMTGFERIFALLRSHPRAGPLRSEFGREVRSIPHPPYRVLYRVEGELVSILRILHMSRRPRRVVP